MRRRVSVFGIFLVSFDLLCLFLQLQQSGDGATSTAGTSASAGRVDAPSTVAQESASAAAPSAISEGSRADRGAS